MPNQNSSRPTPASSGVIAPDWEQFQGAMRFALENDPQQLKAAKEIFYTAYLCCYNRMVQALRDPHPGTAALVTATMRDELNKHFTENENGTG